MGTSIVCASVLLGLAPWLERAEPDVEAAARDLGKLGYEIDLEHLDVDLQPGIVE